MGLKDFEKNITSNPCPINIVTVSDLFLKKKIVNIIEENFKDTHELTKFTLLETSFSEIMTYFKNSPMLGKKLLITVTDAQHIEKSNINELIKLIEKNHKFKNIIFFFFDNLKNKKLLEVFKKTNCYYSISSPDKKTIKGYISGYFKKNNIKFEHGIEDFIIENIGTDLESIFFELEKIKNFSVNLELLTLSNLKKIIFSTKEESIFKFADSFLRKDFKNIFEILHNIMTMNTDIEQILSILINTVTTILNIKSLNQESNLEKKEIQNKLGIHPYSLKKNLSFAHSFSFEELYNILNELINVQYKIRSSGIKKELLFKQFLIEYIDKNK